MEVVVVVVVDCFYIALLSALAQTHCARMRFYMSEQLSIARFCVCFFVVVFLSTEVVYLHRWHG